jgi:hypothetical protein
MPERTVEDQLREEYFDLVSHLRLVAEELEAKIRFQLLPISRILAGHEQLVVKSRVKACDSALDSLRRRQEGMVFDPERKTPYSGERLYSLLELHDLVGVRVLAFPRSRLAEIDHKLRLYFAGWTHAPVPGGPDDAENLVDFKYYGTGLEASPEIPCEYQVVSMLTGLFWEVEHAALYKPSRSLKGVEHPRAMGERTREVHSALRAFEEEFKRLLLAGTESKEK